METHRELINAYGLHFSLYYKLTLVAIFFSAAAAVQIQWHSIDIYISKYNMYYRYEL